MADYKLTNATRLGTITSLGITLVLYVRPYAGRQLTDPGAVEVFITVSADHHKHQLAVDLEHNTVRAKNGRPHFLCESKILRWVRASLEALK